MATIVAYQDKLSLSWHPGCSYMGGSSYAVGAIGRRGPGTTEDELKIPVYNTEIPKCLAFYITIPGSEKHLYDVILTELKLLNDGVEILPRPPQETRVNLNVKEEFKAEYDSVMSKNQQIREKYNELVKQLEELGCDAENIEGPKLEEVPDSWYESTTSFTDSHIEVRCHSETKFYKELLSAGILEKSYPKWYRNGKY